MRRSTAAGALAPLCLLLALGLAAAPAGAEHPVPSEDWDGDGDYDGALELRARALYAPYESYPPLPPEATWLDNFFKVADAVFVRPPSAAACIASSAIYIAGSPFVWATRREESNEEAYRDLFRMTFQRELGDFDGVELYFPLTAAEADPSLAPQIRRRRSTVGPALRRK